MNRHETFIKNLGLLIAQVRDARGLSQETLCDLTIDDSLGEQENKQIVNRSALQRIERGDTGTQLYFYLVVMDVLGIKPSQLFYTLENDYEKDGQDEDTIIRLMNDMNYEQAQAHTESFAKRATTVHQKQFISWAKADTYLHQGGDKVLVRKQLLDALEMTQPKAVQLTRTKKKEKILNLDRFEQLAPNKHEFRIYLSLAEVGSTQENIALYEHLLKQLPMNKLMTQMVKLERAAILHFCITNQLLKAYVQEDVDLDERILLHAQKGLSLERKHHLSRETPKLYYNLGRYYFYQDNLTKAKTFFQRSYMSWLAMDNEDNAKRTLEWVREKYKIELVTC